MSAMPQPTVDRAEADARRTRIAANLAGAAEDLVAAWRRRDWITYGLPTWEAYLDSVTPRGMRVVLDDELLVERTLQLVNGGMSVRAAAPVVGASKTKVADLLRRPDVADQVTATTTRGLDNRVQTRARSRRSATVTELPAKAPTSVDRIVTAAEALVTSGRCPDGVTTLDLMGRLRWRQGPASAAQSRAVKRGRLLWTGTWRDGFGVYDVTAPTG